MDCVGLWIVDGFCGIVDCWYRKWVRNSVRGGEMGLESGLYS